METIKDLFGDLTGIGFSAGVLVGLFIIVFVIHKRLFASYSKKPARQHHRQLIMVCIYLLAAILAIVLMPLGDELRGQLLGFLAILLSATIVLSSTALVGNVLAGVMLRSSPKFKPGDYIHVGNHFGRIANTDLLHVEMQTEDRNLTVLPNLYLVTNPVEVLRSSGTILHVSVSLGYQIPRTKVEEALLAAADLTGLKKPFVQILSLDDFAVNYQISGLLTEIEYLSDTRCKLRAKVLDKLHEASIEVVSANYMNTRAPTSGLGAAPQDDPNPDSVDDQPGADAVAINNTQQVEELDNLKKEYTMLSQDLIGIEQELQEAGPGEQRKPINLRKKKTEARMLRMEKEIARLESALGHG